MKKLICILLALTLLCSLWGCTKPGESAQTPAFTTVSIPCPEYEEMDWSSKNRLTARYADDGTIIPLSTYYDGCLWATIPVENTQREIEYFEIDNEITFPDETEYDWQYYTMRDPIALGIMSTDEAGNALPFAPLSRQEAVTAVMKLFGLPATWEDAEARGIVDGTIPDFTPEGDTTRQEMITLTARALAAAGLAEWKDTTAEEVAEAYALLDDADAIASWALPAYGMLGDAGISEGFQTDELDAEGFPIYKYRCSPEQTILRHEAASILYRARSEYQVYPSQTAIEYGFDQGMPVVDGSTSTYPFTQAVYRSLFLNGYRHPQQPAKHSKSHASYQRLINGEIDMIFASVYPASDILELAAENGVELELIPIAYDAMVFFTNAENPIDGLTIQQISDVYVNDAYENWSELGGPDAPFIPYCRNNDSGSHAQMERHFLNGNDIHENIAPETSMTMSDILTDVMGVPNKTPGAYGLGYSIYYYYHNMDMFYGTLSELKLLEIDGVAPTDETIASGEYPLSNNTYVVLRKDTPQDHPARKMAEFMLTEQGQMCVLEAGFGSLIPGLTLY